MVQVADQHNRRGEPVRTVLGRVVELLLLLVVLTVQVLKFYWTQTIHCPHTLQHWWANKSVPFLVALTKKKSTRTLLQTLKTRSISILIKSPRLENDSILMAAHTHCTDGLNRQKRSSSSSGKTENVTPGFKVERHDLPHITVFDKRKRIWQVMTPTDRWEFECHAKRMYDSRENINNKAINDSAVRSRFAIWSLLLRLCYLFCMIQKNGKEQTNQF